MSDSATMTATRGRSYFLTSKLGSALAVLPLGVWTCLHLWDNLAAFDGAAAWEGAVTAHASPAAQLVTMIVVLGPLFIHTIWGIGRLFSSRPSARHRSFGNLRYVLQRVAAIGVFFFLGAHLWLAMLQPRLAGHAEPFADIAHEMRFHTPTLVVYVLGTLGVAYHLANGVATFAMGSGLAGSRKALVRVERASIVLFLVLLAMSWAVLYALWRAGVAAPGME